MNQEEFDKAFLNGIILILIVIIFSILLIRFFL